MSLKEEETQITNNENLINNEADVMNFLESLASKPLNVAEAETASLPPSEPAAEFLSAPSEENSRVPAPPEPLPEVFAEVLSGPKIDSFEPSVSEDEPEGTPPTPFEMQHIDENAVVATYEEAVRKIVFLEDKLKRKETEIAESQKMIESALMENSDKIELLERAEARIKSCEAEMEILKKTSVHEHEKRRLHLLHVRDLKHAIAERDLRIRQLENSAPAFPAQPAGEAQTAEYEPRIAEAEEVKKLQSDIFYKEIEIEKLNAAILAAQRESLELKAQNDELRNEIESIKLEMSYKDDSVNELKSTIESLENEIKDLSDKYASVSGLNVSAEDLEKLKLASEVKDFLEDELEKLSSTDETDRQEPSAEENAETDHEGAVTADENEGGPEGKKQLGELDEIKEKFKSLIAERDKAIELLDKFEVESKLKERELNELKIKFTALSGEKETADASLKEKETELQGIYSAFSSYKEESGFMSRENKILKEEREALTAEIAKFSETVAGLERAAAAKDEEIKRLAEETEEKLKAAAAESENRLQAMNEEKEEALQRVKTESEAEAETYRTKADECLREAEACRSELESFRAGFSELESKYQSALADYHGMKLNVENLMAAINEILNPAASAESSNSGSVSQVENSITIIRSESFADSASIEAVFEPFAANHELKLTTADCGSQQPESDRETQNSLLFVLAIESEKELLKVFDVKKNPSSPLVVYSKEPACVHKITELISRGVIDDYLDASMDSSVFESVLSRVVEGRLAKIAKVTVKKDNEEIKLRESVALTIDNKVKAGRIEALNERIEYLKESNRKMKAGISEMQKSFDSVIACITNLSLQEIPPGISEGFNEITGILLRITSIKL
ncbi:MAG TPA: hypothetical protein PK467_00030 [Candidatus Wallbacteria bacterium]|nr:hypothetical protein [Candidatus Wallbacteria bacterium]